MQMMNRAGSRWYSRRAAGQLEVGLHLKLNYKRPTPTGSDSERFISFREIDIHSVISINTVYAVLYQENGALVARLVGSILDENHLDFQDCLFGAVDVCRSLSLVALVVDLRDVDYLPSRGLRALSSAMATARLYDIEIVLGRPGPALREVLSISRYDVLFRVVPR
jgi:anti-anti-sigma factor